MWKKIFLNISYYLFFKPIYFLSYWIFYKFSGAHHKPTSDSKYDPQVRHQSSLPYRWLRFLESLFIAYSELPLLQKNRPKKIPNIEMNSLKYESVVTLRNIFNELSCGKTRPVVIKGLIKDTYACNNWSSEYFRTKYGNVNLLNIKRGQHKSNAYTSFNQKLEFSYMSIKESIDNMTASDGIGNDAVYINNVTKLFDKCPELAKELELSRLSKIDSAINDDNWLKINMFMGGKGSGSSLHCAVAGNFFFNVHGKKKWILIDPKYSKFLESTPAKDFSFVISGLDIENPSSLLNRIPKYEVILEPGDVLYNPPWWWHYVKNETDFTIACAIRDHTVYTQSIHNNPTFMLMSPYIWNLNPWFLKIVEWLKGTKELRKISLKSDKSIVSHLSDGF